MSDKQQAVDPDGMQALSAGDIFSGQKKRVAARKPYAAKIPNAESLEAIEQTRTGKGLIRYASADDMMADLFGDDE